MTLTMNGAYRRGDCIITMAGSAWPFTICCWAKVDTFTWGLDLSGTCKARGGVGGLLQARLAGTNHFVLSEGNGNVTAFYDENGEETARYEYEPFGKALRAEGWAALRRDAGHVLP